MPVRLQKFIAESGLTSRRKAEEMIIAGHVRVNGEVAVIGRDVDPEKDEVMVQGIRLKRERKIYLMLHKPRGYITTLADPWARKSVLELIHEHGRVFPIGRLDTDTTGLLLLTNDGDFANRIMHPSFNVAKTYEATLDRKAEEEDIKRIREGIVIDGHVIEATARRIGPKRVRITVHTGLNKEVKRIFKLLGFWVKDLHRVDIGGVHLPGALKEGKYRHLVPSEIEKLLAVSSERKPQPKRPRPGAPGYVPGSQGYTRDYARTLRSRRPVPRVTRDGRRTPSNPSQRTPRKERE